MGKHTHAQCTAQTAARISKSAPEVKEEARKRVGDAGCRFVVILPELVSLSGDGGETKGWWK